MKDKEYAEPLVSDTDIAPKLKGSNYRGVPIYDDGLSPVAVRDLYEAARSKDKERIAALEAAGDWMRKAAGRAPMNWNEAAVLRDACEAWDAARALLNQQPPTT